MGSFEASSLYPLPKETVGRVKAVLIEMLTNDNKEDEDMEDVDKENEEKEDVDKEDDMYIN